ncbi:MAG TPA: PilN domain-containing protein [Edaphobacter sp.]
MKITVNLATRPFVELRPLYAKLRIAAIALAVLALVLGVSLRSLNAKANEAASEMNALKAKTQAFLQERQQNEARMRQPQNRAVLERSQFLNDLFARKSFSWTAVMMDLERVLPAGVQVTSIEPSTSKTGDVNIRLRVSGDRDHAVDLVRNLEKSQRFISPRLADEASQVQEGHTLAASALAPGTVEFDIYSGYNPLPQPPAKSAKASEDEEKPAAKPEQKKPVKRSRAAKPSATAKGARR